MRAKFRALELTDGVRLSAKFRLDRFILSPSVGDKPQFLPSFGSHGDDSDGKHMLREMYA